MIEIAKRPYQYNFSGNPIVYELFDNDAMDDATLSFQVKVIYVRMDGGPETVITTLTVSPYQARAQVDLSSLLHPLLDHYLPPVNNGSTVYGSGSAACFFYIEFRTISPTVTNPAWNSTETSFIRWAYKGGVHVFRYRGNAFFAQYLPNQKPFFTWQIRNKIASLNERIYLGWLNLYYSTLFGGAPTLKLKVRVVYSDQTDVNTEFSIGDLNKGYMYYIPAGATQLNLQALDPSKTIWYWQCWLEDISSVGLGIITEKYSFTSDGRNDYNQIQIHYRNSLGGLDTVRIRGVIQKNIDYQAATTERSASPDFAESATPPALLRTEHAIEQLRYRADIGYLQKEEQDRLRDAMLNREAWMVMFGRFMPLNIFTGAIELTRSDSMKWNMPIEFSLADSGSEYYTPDSVDLGDADPSTNTCTSTITLTHGSTVIDGDNSIVTFNYAVSGTGSGLRWRVPGIAEAWTEIAIASSGSIAFTVGTGTQFTMQMQVVCSADNYGAIGSFGIDTAPAGTPNSTIYNETGIDSTFKIRVNGTQVNIGNVLYESYAAFLFAPVTASELVLELDGINPVQVDLIIGGVTTLGIVTGNIITWVAVTTTSAGITMIIRDEPTN